MVRLACWVGEMSDSGGVSAPAPDCLRIPTRESLRPRVIARARGRDCLETKLARIRIVRGATAVWMIYDPHPVVFDPRSVLAPFLSLFVGMKVCFCLFPLLRYEKRTGQGGRDRQKSSLSGTWVFFSRARVRRRRGGAKHRETPGRDRCRRLAPPPSGRGLKSVGVGCRGFCFLGRPFIARSRARQRQQPPS